MADGTVVWAVWQDAALALPENSGNYLIWVRSPLEDAPIVAPLSYATAAFYDKAGCMWTTHDELEHYCAALDRVDRARAEHVSHWMPMPTGPEDRV